ncbi:hypothetical protein ACHWQZ_G013142 [Mnemiopsis leidyi]
MEDKTKSSRNECSCKQHIDDALMICCEKCQQWFHIKCVQLGGLTKIMIKSIENYECPFCIVSARVLLPPEDHDLSNNDYENLRRVVTSSIKNTLETEFSNFMEKTKADLVAESSKAVKSYVEAVKTEVKTVVEQKPPTQLVKETVRQIDADQQERVKRECNVIINQVPENLSRESDMQFLTNECHIKKEDIITCFRAGRNTNSEAVTSTPRPLVVKLKSKETAQHWCDYGKGRKIICSDEAGCPQGMVTSTSES